MQNNIIITGVGGQGVITAGTLISDAAIAKGLKTVMSEIHGLAQRGGSVSVDVRLGNAYGPIIPEGEADALIAFEPMEALRNLKRVGKKTIIIVSTEKLPPISLGIRRMEYPDINEMMENMAENFTIYPVDAKKLAMEAGNYRALNVVLVGVAISTGVLPLNVDDIIRALERRFSGKLMDINMKALQLGIQAIVPGHVETH